MPKEVRIPFDTISNSQTITQKTDEIFKANDVNIHQHEVIDLQDDFKRQERILKIKNMKFFIVPPLPWKK